MATDLKARKKKHGGYTSGRVERRTVGTYNYQGRRLVVALEPGDVIALREEGRRTWYRAPLSRVFTQIVKWNVEAERREKKAKRRARA